MPLPPPDSTSESSDAPRTVRELRRRWKPTKERLAASAKHEGVRIRIHRACSWLQRIEELGDDCPTDAVLLYRWIALNSLYGKWNEEKREPEPDWQSVKHFAERVEQLDADARIAAMLEEHRKLVMSIFEDEYLTKFFWEEPTDERARKSQKTKFDARTWYQQKQYGLILERVLERVYFLRCQLVHGAATYGGGLNRTAVKRCGIMLGHVVPTMLLVIIDHGYEEDWGALCYPPMRPVSAGWVR